MQGKIMKWHDTYGFIRYAGQDVVVHKKNFLSGSTPELHALVEFRLGPALRDDKSYQAVHVTVVKTAAEMLAEIEHAAGLEALLNTKIEQIADTTVVQSAVAHPENRGGAV
jgi:hypothetical protein